MSTKSGRGAEDAERRRTSNLKQVHVGSAEVAEDTLPLKYRLARRLGSLMGWQSQTASHIRSSKPILDAVVATSDSKALREQLGLGDGFAPWFGLMSLQVWMMMTRLRAEGERGQSFRQALFDQLLVEVEHRVRMSGITQESAVARNVKSLIKSFYGAALSYDEGLLAASQSDVMLASALWRNLYAMSPHVEASDLAATVRYVRSEMLRLQNADAEAIIAGKWVFSQTID